MRFSLYQRCDRGSLRALGAALFTLALLLAMREWNVSVGFVAWIGIMIPASVIVALVFTAISEAKRR